VDLCAICLRKAIITAISAPSSSRRIHSISRSIVATYLILLKNFRFRLHFSRLAHQAYPKYSVDMYDSYLQAIAKPHGYLVLDMSLDINDILRFRNEFFPDESPFPLIYAPVDYERDTIYLSHPTRS
jgi:hypothetical protein